LGKVVAVRGLLGTQVDVIFFLELLDGRKYSATLKPARSAYLIPPPPSLFQLAGSHAFRSMRDVVRTPAIVLLILTLVFLGTPPRDLARSGFTFLLGYAVGHFLLQNKWISLPSDFWVLFALTITLIPIMDFLRSGPEPLSRINPLWSTALLLGAAFGGSEIGADGIDRLASLERGTAFFAQIGGVAVALCVTGFFFSEIRQLWRMARKPGTTEKHRRGIGVILGVASAGLIFYQLSGLLFGATILPPAPIEYYILALATGLWLGFSQIPLNSRSVGLLIVSAAVGIMLGHADIPLPLGSVLPHASVFVIGAAILSGRAGKPKVILPVAAAALLLMGWSTADFLVENISLPVAVSVGAFLFAIALMHVSRLIARDGRDAYSPLAGRLTGLLVLVAAVALRLGDYVDWTDEALGSAMAMGYFPLPLGSLALVAAAVAFWPRRRRIRELLAVQQQRQFLHWAFLAAAFFAFPMLTVNVPNLLYAPAAPTGETARHILKQTLSKTYHAFNLEDEEELYDRLSETVTENLVADIYLDSRRKLTNGVRQGAQVTVRDVDVVSVEDEVSGSNASEGYTYECTWAVTARVTHLQHVHHRRNIYSGTLLIKKSDDRWKIDMIALSSEDRVIVPWRSG
jgi:hypothetical protein